MKKTILMIFTFLFCFIQVACSSEDTSSAEKETQNTNNEDASVNTNEVAINRKKFDFSLGDFQSVYNEGIRALELDKDFKHPIPIRITADTMEDFTRENSKTYTRILAKEYDESDGGYSLNAWFDKSKNFNGLNMTVFNSDGGVSEKGIVAANSVFQTLGIDFNYLRDILKSGKDTLEVTDGDYFIHLTSIEEFLVIKIEPK